METLAENVWTILRDARPDARILANGRSNAALVWWIPTSLARLAWFIIRGQIDFVLTADAFANALADLILRYSNVRRATLVMGLDVTYENRLYRAFVGSALRRTSTVIAISEATADHARALGVRADRVHVMRLGIPAPAMSEGDRAAARNKLEHLVRISRDDVVLLTLGRLVKRKGVKWFVESVLPHLPSRVHYLVAGAGEEEQAIRECASRAGLAGRVHMLGQVGAEDRETVLAGADLFVQPNIPVPGDMEGFGLVTVEAAMRGTVVVAADLEGLRGAVVDGRTGFLIPPADAVVWAARLSELVAHPARLEDIGRRFADESRALHGIDVMRRSLQHLLGLRPVDSDDAS